MKTIKLILGSLLISALSTVHVYSQSDNSELNDKTRVRAFQENKALAIQFNEHDEVLQVHKTVPSGINSLVAYGYAGGLIDGLCYFNLDDPGTITTLGPEIDFLTAGTWADGIWYGEEWMTGNLYEFNPYDGSTTFIGSCGYNIDGLAWDGTTMFFCSSPYFGSLNLENGALTLIGLMGDIGYMIGMACDSAGNIYGVDIYEDKLYSINKTTGAATLIGPLGIDLDDGAGQDMDFDKDNNVLYLSAIVNSTGALYTINTSTGAATLVGEFMNGTQIDAFAIPYGPTTSIPSTKKQTEIRLYPNPVADIATFSSEEITSFEIYDITCSLITRRNSNKVDMSDRNPGIYFVIGFDKHSYPLYKGKIIKK